MATASATASSGDWSADRGETWAKRWRDTDRGLAGVTPLLVSTVIESVPHEPFRAFEVGCGAGTLSLSISTERSDASIVACDISPALVDVARKRLAANEQIRVILGDAQMLAPSEEPFDLIFSRHGVMFFANPVRAFEKLLEASKQDGALVFSCFQEWAVNPWASELASAAANRALPAPGREPGGFAFADPDYVGEILGSAGWTEAEAHRVSFKYVAADGAGAVDAAMSFLGEIGPASVIVESLPEEEREAALDRMRAVIEQHFDGFEVAFPAAAWIWQARAASPA